jgi:hypothetical protein
VQRHSAPVDGRHGQRGGRRRHGGRRVAGGRARLRVTGHGAHTFFPPKHELLSIATWTAISTVLRHHFRVTQFLAA